MKYIIASLLICILHTTISYGNNNNEGPIEFDNTNGIWQITIAEENNELSYVIRNNDNSTIINLLNTKCPTNGTEDKTTNLNKKINKLIDDTIHYLYSEYSLRSPEESKIEKINGEEFSGKLAFTRYTMEVSGNFFTNYNANIMISDGKSIWAGYISTNSIQNYDNALELIKGMKSSKTESEQTSDKKE